MRSSRKAQAVTVLAFSSSLPKANFERTVDSTVHREFALLRKDLGDGDVEGADWVAFERLPWLRLVLQVRQPGDAVSLEHTVKRGARQVLDGRLERIKTIIERHSVGFAERQHKLPLVLLTAPQSGPPAPPSACLPRTCVCTICEPFFGFRRYCAASAATQAFDRCIADRTVCLVAALP